MKHFLLVIVSSLALPLPSAWAQTNTAEIVENTLAAVPACSDYRVTGACFWLRCDAYPPNCRVITNMRISHFSPEVVVSTWHDEATHPWADYGRTAAKLVGGAAAGLIGMAVDSAGTRQTGDRTDSHILFRDADAIGNPTSLANSGMSARMATASRVMPAVPGVDELNKYLQRPPADNRTYAGAGDATSGMTALRRGAGAYAGGGAALDQMRRSLAASAAAAPTSSGRLARAAGFAAPAAASGSMLCPSTAQGFTVHFHSYLDALVWRNVVPVELLYPQSYIPGLQEVGNFPFNTWGSLYPRIGSLTQQIPMKGAAVLAQRVAHIISQSGQPHFYSPLSASWGYRYFDLGPVLPNDPKNSKWQRLYPKPSPTCEVFGSNDTLSLTTWGDGKSASEEGYSWNLWRRLECCKVEGIFIGSIAY